MNRVHVYIFESPSLSNTRTEDNGLSSPRSYICSYKQVYLLYLHTSLLISTDNMSNEYVQYSSLYFLTLSNETIMKRCDSCELLKV